MSAVSSVRPVDKYVRLGDSDARGWAQGEQGSAVLLIHGIIGSVEDWVYNIERDFFKDHLNRKEIVELLQGRPASQMFNFRSPNFKKTGLTREMLSNDKLIEMMLKEPGLVRRAVVRVDARVHFGADRKVLETLVG